MKPLIWRYRAPSHHPNPCCKKKKVILECHLGNGITDVGWQMTAKLRTWSSILYSSLPQPPKGIRYLPPRLVMRIKGTHTRRALRTQNSVEQALIMPAFQSRWNAHRQSTAEGKEMFASLGVLVYQEKINWHFRSSTPLNICAFFHACVNTHTHTRDLNEDLSSSQDAAT